MDVAGLPAAACDLLTTLLAKNRVTSWQVCGKGPNAVFTLRLTATNHEAAMTPATTTLSQWKRKSPSQIRRDQHRAYQRQRQTKVGDTQETLSLPHRKVVSVKTNDTVCKEVIPDKQRGQADKHTVGEVSTYARGSRCPDNVTHSVAAQPGVMTRSKAKNKNTGHGRVTGDAEKRAENISATVGDSVRRKGHSSVQYTETDTPVETTSTDSDLASSIGDMERSLERWDEVINMLRNSSSGRDSAPGD